MMLEDECTLSAHLPSPAHVRASPTCSFFCINTRRRLHALSRCLGCPTLPYREPYRAIDLDMPMARVVCAVSCMTLAHALHHDLLLS